VARPVHEPPSVEELRSLWSQCSGVPHDQLMASTIHRENEQAIGHLFRVASGLDSMVLGEPQILGQVKRAYEAANQKATVGPVLHMVFQKATAVAKQVRSATGIDSGRVSIGSVAVDFARQIFESFADKTVVGIGAGEMAKLALRHMASLEPARLFIANRSVDRATQLAQTLNLQSPHGVRSFDDLDRLLVEADIVVSSTASPTPIITAERFKPLVKQRRARPLFLIDLALPRDVEPAVGTLANVFLYNLDDLQAVVTRTHDDRGEAARQCEAMLTEHVKAAMSQVQHRDVGQLIRQLRGKLHALGEQEQQRTLRKLQGASPEELPALVEEHTQRVINKILHMPLSQLDRRDAEAPLGFLAAALRRLFQLDDACASGASDSTDSASKSTSVQGDESQDKPVTLSDAGRQQRA
jgi:glutamyl-tRNA reductase